MPEQLPCGFDGVRSFKAGGEGYGRTRQQAFDNAWAQASLQIDLQVANLKCPEPCPGGAVADPEEPDHNCDLAPRYHAIPDSAGYRCTLTLCRVVRFTCAAPPPPPTPTDKSAARNEPHRG